MLEMSQDGQFLNGEYILRHSQRCAGSPFPRARSCRTAEMHAQLACARAGGGGGSSANEGLREASGGSGRFFPIGVFVHLKHRSRGPLDLDSIRLPYTATDDRQRIHNTKGAGTPRLPPRHRQSVVGRVITCKHHRCLGPPHAESLDFF